MRSNPINSSTQASAQRRHAAVRCAHVTCAAAVAAPTAPPAVRDAVTHHLSGVKFFAPPLTNEPGKLLAQNVPFLTCQAGALPVQPKSLEHALYLYGEYASKYVSVRVDNEHVKLRSWEHAVAALEGAQASGASYWCSLLEGVRHPDWWPEGRHVPNYDQVIFGRGNASIGLHYDKDNACAGGSRQPVSTYLAISAGRKLVLLLPPGQKLLPAGGDANTLLHPTPKLLAQVKAAGGHFFILEDLTRRQGTESSGAGSNPGGFSATALSMPAGWWHWVVGLTDWHVVYGGSFYPSSPVEP